LRLLDSEELQALVAHEIGHEYVWQEYALARTRNDTARLRELELACDSIAVLTLARIGVKPDRLVTALAKGRRFNHDRFGQPNNENSYPSLQARRKLVKRISAEGAVQERSVAGVH
jgi:Zn-dependent protease with chaperone function